MFENYIEESLISALAQKTNFEYEILVRDDFSTDKSETHIKRIAASNGNIRFFEALENLGPYDNFKFLYEQAKGEYIAILDGDDYWDNSNLLQKSVDFLDNNPEYILSFTGHRCKYMSNNCEIDPVDVNEWIGLPDEKNGIVTTEDLLETNYVGFGKVFRRIPNLFENWMGDLPYTDWGITYKLSKIRKIKYLRFPGGIYRKHEKGIYSGAEEQKVIKDFNTCKDIINTNYMSYKKIINTFKTRINFNKNRYYLTSNIDFKIPLTIYFYDSNNLIYSVNIEVKKGVEHWFSIDPKFEEIKKLMVQIFEGKKLIYCK